MEHRNRHDEVNPWKWATLGIIGLAAVALTAGLVVANYPTDGASETKGTSAPKVASAPDPAPASRPSTSAIEECNAYARNVRNQTEEAVKGAIVGGAVGAGVGAAGGAIAKGGKGAGKGAGIGSLLGATVGTLYGLNQANQANAQAEAAYRRCMARRGYSG